MKYCTNCGHQLADEAKFCTKCGNSIVPSQATNNLSPMNEQVIGNNAQKKVRFRKVLPFHNQYYQLDIIVYAKLDKNRSQYWDKLFQLQQGYRTRVQHLDDHHWPG
jgi:uncharacterized membrane protein YvbJ